MKRTYRNIIIASLALRLVMASAVTAIAGESAGVPGDWLSRYAGARTVGIGGAFVAAADEPLGAVWNPAGLSAIMQNEVHFESARLFEGTSVNALSFVVPAQRFPTLGLTVLSLGSGDFERTNELNEPLGSFKEGDMAFLFSASKSVTDKLSLGANVKVVRQSIEDFHGTGVGADLGVMYDVGRSVQVGASVLNIGGPSVTLRELGEKYPTEFRGGFSLRFFSGRGLLSAELDHREGPGASFHTGTEVWVHDAIALRAGYYDTEPAGGFSYRINHAARFDYGMSNHELGIVHRFAVSYRFGGFFAHSEAYPAVFSPMGENSVTKFQLKSRTKSETKRWRLDIYDKHNEIVRTFGGPGVPPAHVMWDGKNNAGLTLADGVYRYKLVVTDVDGRTSIAEEKTVEITTSGPQGSVPVIIE